MSNIHNNLSGISAYQNINKTTVENKQKIEKVTEVSETQVETKVERIKRELAEGNYKLDLEKTANALADKLI